MPEFRAQINANKIPIKGLVAETSATAPVSPANGQLWTDTSAGNRAKVYHGSRWWNLGSLTGETTVSASGLAANAMASVNVAMTLPTGCRGFADLRGWVNGATTLQIRQVTATVTGLEIVVINLGNTAITFSNQPISWGVLPG